MTTVLPGEEAADFVGISQAIAVLSSSAALGLGMGLQKHVAESSNPCFRGIPIKPSIDPFVHGLNDLFQPLFGLQCAWRGHIYIRHHWSTERSSNGVEHLRTILAHRSRSTTDCAKMMLFCTVYPYIILRELGSVQLGRKLMSRPCLSRLECTGFC